MGYNQTDFASLGGVNRSSQAEYEGGKRPFSASYLLGLSAAGVDVNYVMTGVRVPAIRMSDPTLVTMRVAMPPREALAEMFSAFLMVYPDLHGDELAQALARHLPTGLAQLTDLLPIEVPSTARVQAAVPDQPEGRHAPQSATRR